MRVQIVISGLLLDPGCDVGADFLIIRVLVDWPITNKVLVYLFKLLRGAAAVDWEYSVRLVITLLFKKCFCPLFYTFYGYSIFVNNYKANQSINYHQLDVIN